MLDYQVVRSNRRKTIALQVRQGKVLVRAPHFVDKQFLDDLIKTKSAWLQAKILSQSQLAYSPCNFNHGDLVMVFGQQTRLQLAFAKKSDTKLISESVEQKPLLAVVLLERYKALTNEQLTHIVKKQIETFFKQQAKQIILPKVAHFSHITQLIPNEIKIRKYSARWGSCNSRDELSFNYLMMMLPDNVIDYIVIHELCHLRFLNHSKQFWQLVAKYFPQYLQAKAWLKAHQSQLVWQLP